MAKLAYLFTDFHAHLFKDFSTVDPVYHTDRFKAQLDTLQTILSKAREDNKPVIFVGDLFHKRVSVDARVFNPIFEMFASYADVSVYMVRGNHDSVTNSLRTISSLDPFEVLPNVTVLSEPMVVEISTGFTLYALPYGEEVTEMKEWLTAQSEHAETNIKPTLLVGHIGVAGATVGKSSHALEGSFTAGDLYPDKFDYVYLGHYHKRQELLPNMIYGGNTIQTSFSDEGQSKGYHALFSMKQGLTTEYIEIPNKQFITVTGADIPDEETLRSNYIRFVGDAQQAEIVQKLRDSEGLTNMQITVQKDYNEGPRLGITAETPEEEIVSAYISSKELPSGINDKALKCLKQAKDAR